MEKNAFIFDSNKCVACMACAAGCSIENGTSIPLNWRVVNTHNKIKHPQLPVFHFSLACNHCDDAPCMKNCPALAYSRDEKTGAIIHHAEACIGCTYCTWACPYDAPKYNEETKIVEKCNFCVNRISKGSEPACVQACPVGALSFGNKEQVNTETHLTPGFVNADIRPSIQLIPLRKEHTKPDIENLDTPEISEEQLASYLPKTESKVELKKEWPLVLFTLAVAALVAWQWAGFLGKIAVPPFAFFTVAFASIVFTSMHVGKKMRIWRFFLNIKGSWLSREILSFSLFLGFSGLALLIEANLFGLGRVNDLIESKRFAYIGGAFGLIALLSVDMVYALLVRKDNFKLHSAMICLSAPLLFASLSGFLVLWIVMASVKLLWYVVRKVAIQKQETPWFPLLSLSRVLLLIVPLLIFMLKPDASLWYIFSLIFMGEIIDRSEFYYESEVQSPQRELNKLSVS